jgi:hypothetical protein
LWKGIWAETEPVKKNSRSQFLQRRTNRRAMFELA